jgi:glycosyltransferase involved in cell wall biosynthesis
MRIIIVTDTWEPDINGVARTLGATRDELVRLGHDVVVMEPSRFHYFRCPLYPELRLSFAIDPHPLLRTVRPPYALHIATEGPVGMAFSAYCRQHKIPFTTSYHTNFPDYLRTYAWIPEGVTYSFLRSFHGKARRLMVSTPTLEARLRARGFTVPMVRWSRGVDLTLFRPAQKEKRDRPVALYVGRAAREKNIEAFLEAKVDVDKWVVGDGPHLSALKSRYPAARYLGYLRGEALASAYAEADVLVFPSRTDTFGIVMIEALACGVPVAAYPVVGPIDVIANHPGVGCLSESLEEAITGALKTGCPEACRDLAERYAWRDCTQQFLENLAVHAPVDHEVAARGVPSFRG